MTAIESSNDRFAVSILMALGLHAVVLLGVGFVVDFKPLTPSTGNTGRGIGQLAFRIDTR